MPDTPDEETGPGQERDLGEEVGAKETRKIRARRESDRTIWFGLGMFGVIGWSVAVPTVLGVALGLWIDKNWPSGFSWTIAMLLAGVTLGAFNAWYWVAREQQAMDEERKTRNHE